MKKYEEHAFAGILLQNRTSTVSNRYFNSWFTIKDSILKKTSITFDDSIQREYLFSDVVGAAGDIWQRNLFASIINGEPIGQAEFWFTEGDGIIRVISLDAQQRMKTMLAIADDCVKTPKGTIVDGEDVGDLHYSALPKWLIERFLAYPFNSCVAVEISADEAVTRFKKLNDSNTLSHQDKRSPEQHELAKYIQNTSHRNRSKFISPNMIKINDSLKLKFFGFPHKGRVLEEQFAYFFCTIYHNKIVSKTKGILDNMYRDVRLDSAKFKKRFVTEFEGCIDTLDKLVKSPTYRSIVNQNGTKNIVKVTDLLQMLLLINRIQKSGGVINSDTFVQCFFNAVNTARANKKLKYTFKNESSDFNATWRLSTNSEGITWINDILFNGLDSTAYNTKDIRTTFTKDEKNQKHQEQGCKCGYCSNELSLKDAIGDHKIPHCRGGVTEYSNLVVSCKSCNDMKGSLPFDGWAWALYGMSKHTIDLRETV